MSSNVNTKCDSFCGVNSYRKSELHVSIKGNCSLPASCFSMTDARRYLGPISSARGSAFCADNEPHAFDFWLCAAGHKVSRQARPVRLFFSLAKTNRTDWTGEPNTNFPPTENRADQGPVVFGGVARVPSRARLNSFLSVGEGGAEARNDCPHAGQAKRNLAALCGTPQATFHVARKIRRIFGGSEGKKEHQIFPFRKNSRYVPARASRRENCGVWRSFAQKLHRNFVGFLIARKRLACCYQLRANL